MSKLDKPDAMELDSDREAQDTDDPITATYPVFLNPSLPSGRRLLVLQHPNRTDDIPRPPPTELRLKAHAGMVEVDIPVDSSQNVYDREKGQRWGRSLHASTAAKGGGSHGLAGGFGFGAVQQRVPGGGRKKSEGLDNDEDVMLDWNESVRQGKALTTQTLGGQFPDASDVQYMVGVFQGKNLHLTPAASMVHLRPQLHHIDATANLEKRNAESGSGGAGGGAGGGAPSGQAAKAIHMTIKNTADGDAVITETMADRLRAVQSETWRKMRYTDENEEAAWEVYNESLFLRDQDAPEKPPAKEGEEEKEEKADVHDDLEETMPRFATQWGDKELLEAVSGIQKEEPQPEPEVKPDPEPKPAPKPAATVAEAAPPVRKATRGRGGGAGLRRGGRA